MIPDLMSSEESDGESEDIIVVKPLCWRSTTVGRFLQQLDDKREDSKSAQAKRQRKQRIISSCPLARPKPSTASLPGWAFD